MPPNRQGEPAVEAVHDPGTETLAELGRLRRRTRGTLRSVWFPLVLFGGLTILSAPLYAIGGAALGVFWLVAAPAGIVATSMHFRRRELRLGLEGPAAPYVLTGVAMAVAAWLTGALGGGGDVSTYGPPLAIAAGTLVFAALDRSVQLAAVAAALFAVAGAVALAGVGSPGPVLAVSFGAGYLIAGLIFRRDERRRG